MIKIGVCDDNLAYAQLLSELTAQHFGAADAITCYTSADSLRYAVVDRNKVFDILLLDIDLGENGDNGIDLAAALHTRLPHCQVIFVTGHSHFAPAVYETPHVYFVLKDKVSHWLPKALDKARAALDLLRSGQFTFTYDRRFYQLPFMDIVYCERHRRITRILTKGHEYKCSEKLEQIDSVAPPGIFVQCHKSFLINLFYVHSHQGNEIFLRDGIIIPVSRQYAQKTREAINAYISRAI